LQLEIPPSLNNIYMNVKRGGRVKTREGRDWFEQAEMIARIEVVKQKFEYSKKNRFGIRMIFYFEKDNRDGDNCIKPTQDAIANVLGINDNRVIEWRVSKRIDKLNPRAEVELWVIE
jgi:Holliday junction resolvase RusA-like endonuclease